MGLKNILLTVKHFDATINNGQIERISTHVIKSENF